MFPFRRRHPAPTDETARTASDQPPEPPPPPDEPTEEQVLDAGPAVDWGGDPSRLSG